MLIEIVEYFEDGIVIKIMKIELIHEIMSQLIYLLNEYALNDL
jgi:hypothetical protein